MAPSAMPVCSTTPHPHHLADSSSWLLVLKQLVYTAVVVHLIRRYHDDQASMTPNADMRLETARHSLQAHQQHITALHHAHYQASQHATLDASRFKSK